MAVVKILFMICSTNADLREDISERNGFSLRTVMQDILRSAKIHDVILVAHESSQTSDRLLEVTSESVITFVPVRLVTVDISVQFPIKKLATGRTLLIHVCPNQSDQINAHLDIILQVTRMLTYEDHTPKVLFVFGSRNASANFEPLFRHMWNFLILDMTVLELVATDFDGTVMNIHQYNPFLEAYAQDIYTPNVTWFPDKLKNMHGYKLTINNNHNPPYDVSEKDSDGRYILGSTSGHVFNSIAKMMNFKIVVDENSRNTVHHLQANQNSSQIEIMYSLFLIRASPLKFAHTFPVIQGRLCLVLPTSLTKMTIFAPWKMIVTAFVGVTIVAIFWLCSTILKFESHLRQPLTIISVILSIPLAKNPNRFVEKIIFMSLVIASTRYTSMFYAQMVMSAVSHETELDIKDLGDLDKSGLNAVFTDLFYDVYVVENTELPTALRSRVFRSSDVDKETCMNRLIHYRNVTCFMEETKAYMEIRRYGRSVMKVSKFCSERYPVVYLLRKGSPYVDKINIAMMRIVESDLWHKWLRDYLRGWAGKNRMRFTEELPEPVTGIGKIPVQILFGVCLTPILIFFLEIIVYRCRKRR